MTVAISMLRSVAWLDEASNTASESFGWVLDGRMTGNIDRPTVAMMQATPSLEARKVRPARRARKPAAASNGATTPSSGTMPSHGVVRKFCSHAVGLITTVLPSGLEGPSHTIGLVDRKSGG